MERHARCLSAVQLGQHHGGQVAAARNQMRLLVAARTDLVLVRDSKCDGVANYLQDCSKRHVKLPKKLMEQLDGLRQEGDGGMDNAAEGLRLRRTLMAREDLSQLMG